MACNDYHSNYDAERTELRTMLCEACQYADSSKFSPRLSKWWKQHQKEDRERLEYQMAEKKKKADKKALLNKLTPYERSLLKG